MKFAVFATVAILCIVYTLGTVVSDADESNAVANVTLNLTLKKEPEPATKAKSTPDRKQNEVSESLKLFTTLNEYYQVGKMLLKQYGLFKADNAAVRGIFGLPFTAVVYVVSLVIGFIVMMAFYESPLSPFPVPPLPHPPVGRFPPEHPIWPPQRRTGPGPVGKNQYSRSDPEPSIRQIVNSVRNQQVNQFTRHPQQQQQHEPQASELRPQYATVPKHLPQQKQQQQPQQPQQQPEHLQLSQNEAKAIQQKQQQQVAKETAAKPLVVEKQPKPLVIEVTRGHKEDDKDDEDDKVDSHRRRNVSVNVEYEHLESEGDGSVDEKRKQQQEHQLARQRLKYQQQLLQKEFNTHQQLFATQQQGNSNNNRPE